jgi:hypothetical protein
MAEKSYLDTSIAARAKADATLEEVRKALESGDLEGYSTSMKTLESDVKELNKTLRNVEFDLLAKESAPMIAAVQKFYIDLIKISEKRDKDDGVITGVELESRKARIDLEKFCDFAKLDKTWATNCDKLLEKLYLRECDVYSMKPSELAARSFYFISQAKKKLEGETPDSNTQIVRLIQEIIDGAIFVDNGKGQNLYKCTTHDIAFIQDAVTKFDAKEKCGIALMNQRQFKTVMMGVFAHCLGEMYTVKAIKTKNA